MAPQAVSIQSLPADLLIEVFALLPFHERHRTLPLVCRAWAAACSGPSRLWAAVDADVREYSAQHGCTVDAELLRRWLAGRAAGIETLNARVSWVPAPIRCLNSPDEAATASIILGPLLQGGSALSNLRLMLPDRTPLRGADCTDISRARGLTRLELLGHASADAVEVGMGELCLLESLRELRLGFRCSFAPRRLSKLGASLSLLGSLTHLEVACPGADLGPVPGTLATLTALRHLRLQEGFQPLWPLPAGLGRLPLTHLSLGGLEPIPPSASRLGMWDEVQQMAGLRTLDLRGLDVVGFPPVVQLPHLQELTLQSCYMVGLQSLPPGLLRGMSALTSLTLSNCELDAVPPFITGAPALCVLNLSANDLAGGLPDKQYLAGLTELDLSGNQFGPGLLLSLPAAFRLKKLSLDGNHAVMVDAKAALLKMLPSLRPGLLTLPAACGLGHASA